MIIRARAPLRLGLAGGGTDVSPYCDSYGGYVLNATLDRYAYAVIKTLNKPVVKFASTDTQSEEVRPVEDAFELNGSLNLHKAIYRHMMQHYNEGRRIPLELTTFCDAPPGSGLGSSSTLVVAMIRAFVELLNAPLDDHAIAQLAYRLERVECGLQGGRQDQYSATFGGFNFMEFYDNDRAVINPLRIKNWVLCELEASLILFYSGISRQSAKIIAEQSGGVAAGAPEAIDAMHGIKREALVMKESLLRGDFSQMVASMREGWINKKRSSTSVSNPSMDRIYDAAVDAGAVAGKISGAGGGGFMLFFAPTERRLDVMRALKDFEGYATNCHFTKHGSQAWRL
jgi:D-glycero-alpha-D-manno-heptose-7-phosphate kinase